MATKTYEFYITIVGSGETMEDCWIDAIEGFSLDCGSLPEDEFKLISIED